MHGASDRDSATTNASRRRSDRPVTARPVVRRRRARVMKPRARFVASLAGITLIALLVRLAFHALYAPPPPPLSDGLFFHLPANPLPEGHGFIRPLLFT